MLHLFQYFGSLPVELQTEIWSYAIRSAKPGIQVFSLSSNHICQPPESSANEAPWAYTYYLTAPKRAFGPKSHQASAIDGETIRSWTGDNPSTYLIDSGLWNACKQSRHTMRNKLGTTEPMAIRTSMSGARSDAEASGPESFCTEQRNIIVSPSQDLFILQLDDPDMFGWSLSQYVVPDSAVPAPIQIRNVGWEYEAIWASSLHEASWIRSLDSLCCYIVYGAKFGGLETLWLINYHLKRKHWQSSREELDRSELKVFETDDFRLTEVVVDDRVVFDGLVEQLSWYEAVEGGDSYTLTDFLAFVRQLRRLVTDTFQSVPALKASKRTISVKVLAYEDPK